MRNKLQPGKMISLDKVYSVLARDFHFWLPDYSDILRPLTKDGNYIPDTDKGFKHYCIWLTDYLTNNQIPVAEYQKPIIKRLKRRKEISNAYMLANAGISMEYFFDNADLLEIYPDNFLENPDSSRISKKELNYFKKYICIPNFRRLNEEENLQAGLVFVYVSVQQNLIYRNIPGPRWCDIGWRSILQEGLKTVDDSKDKIFFTKNFINEIAYMQSK